MADQLVGGIWRTRRGTPINTVLKTCDASLLPIVGDICVIGADSEVESAVSTPSTATIAQRTVFGICVGSNDGGILNRPGYIAANTAGQNLQPYGQAHFGGRGSRASSLSPARQRLIAQVSSDDEFVFSRKDTTAVVPGVTKCGFDRVAAGDYVLDVADAQNVVLVTGYYEPDITAGVAATAARVWGRFLLFNDIEEEDTVA